MSAPLNRVFNRLATLRSFFPRSFFPRPFFLPLLILTAYFFLPSAAHAQFDRFITVNSVSGQFVVTSAQQYSQLLHDPLYATNNNYLRLDPALLAVSAERFKQSVWEQLGINLNSPWVGKIFLALHPAHSPQDTATITVGPFLKTWACRVELPDLITKARYGRSLSAALLLELACRNQTDPSHVPEIPAWLADGMAQLTLAHDLDKIALSLPAHSVDGLMQSRMENDQRGLDPSANALKVLQHSPVLTFDQLCWPDDPEINGQDGGTYLASAQMFTTYLLTLPDGPAKLRNFLAGLPGCLNWQTAFFKAFANDFKRPLEVEKWWSLYMVRFNARDPGPHWTAGFSRDRLTALLTVPVEYRSDSNSLPQHMQVSLQDAVRGFSAEERETVLIPRLRELQMAEFRLTQPFATLAAGYAQALSDFLGEGPRPKPSPLNKHIVGRPITASVATTVKKLNQVDAQRRTAEAKLKPESFTGD